MEFHKRYFVLHSIQCHIFTSIHPSSNYRQKNFRQRKQWRKYFATVDKIACFCSHSRADLILTENVFCLCDEKYLEMSGFEPEASYMRSKRSTTELHPHMSTLCRKCIVSIVGKYRYDQRRSLDFCLGGGRRPMPPSTFFVSSGGRPDSVGGGGSSRIVSGNCRWRSVKLPQFTSIPGHFFSFPRHLEVTCHLWTLTAREFRETWQVCLHIQRT